MMRDHRANDSAFAESQPKFRGDFPSGSLKPLPVGGASWIRAIGILGLSLLALPAHAEGLMQQVSGVWTLTFRAKQMPDGTK